MSNENHQLFTTEQIRQRLEEGGESARWLAQGRCCSNQGTIPQFGDLIS